MRYAARAVRGQVIIMVTFALFAMCGMLGLAVDLGYAYFTKKAAQAAADAAALAAVEEALRRAGEDGPYVCGPLGCQAQECLPSSGRSLSTNFDVGCAYAERNGFTTQGRRHVVLEGGAWNGGTLASPPTVPEVRAYYWVTARVWEEIPQLFSAVLGNQQATVAARATAAIVDARLFGSLILLNRERDPSPLGTGVNFSGGGNSTVYGGDGIVLSSAAAGGPYAADSQSGSGGGTVTVRAPFTFVRGRGRINPTLDWQSTVPGMPAWQNGLPDRSVFKDPFRGRGQPLPPQNFLGPSTEFPVLNGIIQGSNDPQNPTVVRPGYYYAVDKNGRATGDPITFKGYVRFTASGGQFQTIPRDAAPTGFGSWVFFGGASFSSNTSALFDPGRYFFAGAKPKPNGSPGEVFSFANQVRLEDHTPLSPEGTSQPNSDAGAIFVFTDANYVGWTDATGFVPLEVPSAVQAIRDQLKFGVVNMQAGNNSSTYINLHGLNNDPATPGYSQVPPELENFRLVTFWQDQRNSLIRYTGGRVDTTSCSVGIDGNTPPGPNNPCPNTQLADPRSPEMRLQATPNTHIYGAVYQPRGAWLILQGSGVMVSPLQVVTGALDVQGGPTVTLYGIRRPLQRRIVALVE